MREILVARPATCKLALESISRTPFSRLASEHYSKAEWEGQQRAMMSKIKVVQRTGSPVDITMKPEKTGPKE